MEIDSFDHRRHPPIMKFVAECHRKFWSWMMLALVCMPFGLMSQTSPSINDANRGAIDVPVGPRVFLNDQARLTFSAAWKEFRETHTYNLDGEFENGGSCPENQDTLDAFYIYLGKNRITKTIHFMQRCGLCSGSGKLGSALDNVSGNNNCPNCRGSGKEEAAATYTFFVLPSNIPSKPETPRQKQEKALRESVAKELAELELSHSAGNAQASLRLGKIYAEGYHFIPKDISKSEPYFLKAMTLGSEIALSGYLKAREEAFKGQTNDAIVIYALRLSSPATSQAAPLIKLSYTDHLIAQTISERTLALLRKGKLTPEDLKISKLRDIARSPNGSEPIESRRTPKINFIIQEFLSNDRPPRIAGSSFKKLQQVALAKGNGSFGMLGDFIQNGEGPGSLRNAQAAHIYYNLEYLTSGDPYALESARSIEASIDAKTTSFFVNQYRHLAYNNTINETMLQAIEEIHSILEITK